MQNSVLVKFDGDPLIVVLAHDVEFKPIDEILDIYARIMGISRSRLTGHWLTTIDLTASDGTGSFVRPNAENPWPEN